MTTQTPPRQTPNMGAGPDAPGGLPRPDDRQRAAGRRMATILRKELREIFRDKRTLMGIVVGPLLVTPGLFALLGLVGLGQAERTRAKTHTIGLIAPAPAPRVVAALRAVPNLRLETINERSDAEARIRKRQLSAAVVLPADAPTRLADSQTLSVQVLHDAGNEGSRAGAKLVERGLEGLGKTLVGERLRARNLSPALVTPFQIAQTPVPGGGSLATFILSMLVPYTLILSVFMGGVQAAFDQVAGEKERGTLETLLVSPASRRDIVLGKFGAVIAVCLVCGVLTIVGLVIPFVSGLKAFDWLAQGEVTLKPTAIAAVLLILLPLSVLFAGMLLAVSTWARNQKEAQTYLSTLLPLVLAPAALSLVLAADEAPRLLALVPILNASLIIKQALGGSVDMVFIGLSFVASIAYAGAALAFATKLFEKESVLIKA